MVRVRARRARAGAAGASRTIASTVRGFSVGALHWHGEVLLELVELLLGRGGGDGRRHTLLEQPVECHLALLREGAVRRALGDRDGDLVLAARGCVLGGLDRRPNSQ